MKIIQFSAENFKKLRVVSIEPKGGLVQITGPNGAGKSSVLDAIRAALGGKDQVPDVPIRKGEDTARIRLDMGEIIVTRRFREGRPTDMIIENADKSRPVGPQRLLDDMLGEIAFDPLAFTRMKPGDQFETLRRLVPLAVNIDALDGQNKTDFETRTDVNRRQKERQAAANTTIVPDGLPEAAPDTVELLAELDRATRHNNEIDQRRTRREGVAREIEQHRTVARSIEGEIARIEAQLAEAKAALADRVGQADAQQKLLDEAPALPFPIDALPITKQIADAGKIRDGIKARERKADLQKEADDLKAEAEQLTANMAARDKQRAEAIAAAVMPIPGVTFGDRVVLYEGLPLDQASSAVQLRLSVKVAMAMAPKIRVMLVKDGSLLDEQGLATLAEMAQAEDYQIWLERVDTSGRVGIIMEDGSVAADRQEAAEA